MNLDDSSALALLKDSFRSSFTNEDIRLISRELHSDILKRSELKPTTELMPWTIVAGKKLIYWDDIRIVISFLLLNHSQVVLRLVETNQSGETPVTLMSFIRVLNLCAKYFDSESVPDKESIDYLISESGIPEDIFLDLLDFLIDRYTSATIKKILAEVHSNEPTYGLFSNVYSYLAEIAEYVRSLYPQLN